MGGGFSNPGPQCQVKDWFADELDSGTSPLTVHRGPAFVAEEPKPLGGRRPPEASDSRPSREADGAMMDQDIDLIAASPFGWGKEGREIVALLRALRKRGKVIYGKTGDEARGDWDGDLIRVNEDYRGRMFTTVSVLVHEATHALWRKHHRTNKDGEAGKKESIDDEMHAEENELVIYVYLKKKKGCPDDPELEPRLKSQADGHLRRDIAARFE